MGRWQRVGRGWEEVENLISVLGGSGGFGSSGVGGWRGRLRWW